MTERYQATLQGFHPSANPQPQSAPSDTNYMLMLRGLITAVQADISSVADPQHLTPLSIEWARTRLAGKKSIKQFTAIDFGYYAMFCTETGEFYADLQATALKSGDNDPFVNFGRKAEIAKALQDTLLAKGLTVAAAERTQALTPERKI